MNLITAFNVLCRALVLFAACAVTIAHAADPIKIGAGSTQDRPTCRWCDSDTVAQH